MSGFTQSAIAFMQEHGEWAVLVVFALAFCESFAFISLIVPATAILFGFSGLMGASGLEYWSIWGAATAGAIAGDWLAYELAYRFKARIIAAWPLSRHPALVARGVRFFHRFGMIAVFCGRFFGPLRAIVPIVAGLHAMPRLKFQAANLASAVVWATGILTPGFVGARWLLS
jgi:membrane protein DedA with SNARE-associated domain